jgi:superfamily II DNA or RNA helicase
MATPQFQSKILRRKTTPDEYRIYKAALEWALIDPIVIESRDDFKSESRWRERLEPYHHQVTNLITFCRRLPVTLLADDVGLGKTISAGLVISELISRSRISKILIVCPKLLGPQWQEELREKFDIPAEIAIGSALVDAEPEENGAVITTYQSARAQLEKIPQDRFQMLILDEAHKLRNLYGVDQPPQVAVRFRKALEDRRFRFVLMLTATPIQNRLWDLYSLVDLLAVARGHQNPLGSEGMFARKFIADDREKARQLKPESRDEFRSIVYSYMSRVRRGDAKLDFPERKVQMHRVQPTPEELQLIQVIAKPIQKLNRLAQISILQALASSPDALRAQLNNMAQKQTVPRELADTVQNIVKRMPTSAKLKGLGALIDGLKREDPERWRLVVFTTRLETQTTIEAFLSQRGLKVGVINGSSGARNQETIRRFRSNPPECRVIVSTEAGSEGVNLQVANVLVNFDLPWNPMIVEQRIGRVQRLASEHKSVGIFNIMLSGTFEEYIVGRLMEKLQMAAHAIGDIESLLEGSGVEDGEDGEGGFEERIRALIVDALAGKDMERATRLVEQSIENAKRELEREEASINEMLGSMDGAEYVGPRAPTLPPVERSMESSEFVLHALQSLGARVSEYAPGVHLIEQNGRREYIRFDAEEPSVRSTLYAPGSAAFARLVSQMVATGVCDLADADVEPKRRVQEVARRWAAQFGATLTGIAFEDVDRRFAGIALVRVQATVAHDSYERLIDVRCSPSEHRVSSGQSAFDPIATVVEKPESVGINIASLVGAASRDPAIAEFSRFYLERREQEIAAAGDDQRKRKKLTDDFTPGLSTTLVGLDGAVDRITKIKARYRFDTEEQYVSHLEIVPSTEEITSAPQFARCTQSARELPSDCLGECTITHARALKHLLAVSEVSGRLALLEYTEICSVSGKRVLRDECEPSAVTGKPVATAELMTSDVSGKRAEPIHFGRCEFTGAKALVSELAKSEVSGKLFRADQKLRSIVSGRTGHATEFIECHETRQPIEVSEAETCEMTGHKVRPGVLERCAVTGKRVLPSELERCVGADKRVLKQLLVTSSISQARIQKDLAIASAGGNFCTPAESRACAWSGRRTHPDDIRVCALTGLSIGVEFCTLDPPPRLQPLTELLDGMKRTANSSQKWPALAQKLSDALRGAKCKIEAAAFSPDSRHLAVTAEVRTKLGFKTQHVGFVYSIDDESIVGRLAVGKRSAQGWTGINT